MCFSGLTHATDVEMLIEIGFDIAIFCPQDTPIVLKLLIEQARTADLLGREQVHTDPLAALTEGADEFANRTLTGAVRAGDTRLYLKTTVKDPGVPDAADFDANQVPIERLPLDILRFVKPSRYCESDMLADIAWSLFGTVTPGWARVQAVCDYVHGQLRFDYSAASVFRTAAGANQERVGVCRDFTHLAVALCRALNIPARYCNGYLGDIGVPSDPAPMDFNAWFEVYLGDKWYTFDARHNQRRIGRIVICRGLDAADCAMVQTFGQHILKSFQVFTKQSGPIRLRGMTVA